MVFSFIDNMIVFTAILLILELIGIEYYWFIKSRPSKIRNTVQLGFFFILLWVIFSSLYNTSHQIDIKYIFRAISDTSIIVAAYYLTSTVSLIFYNHVGIKRTVFFSLIASYQLTLNTMIILFFDDKSHIIYTVLDFYIVLIPSSMILLIIHDYKNNFPIQKETYRNLELVIFKSSTYYLLAVIPFYVYSFINPEFHEIFAYYVVLLLILGKNLLMLIKVDQIRFFKGSSHFTLLIQTDSGGLIYSKEFMNEEKSEYNQLLSNWLKAFSTIISQFFKSNVNPLEIVIQNNLKIYFEWSDELFVAVIADFTSPLIKPAMKTLSNLLNEFKTNNKFDENDTKKINSLVEECFYFVPKI